MGLPQKLQNLHVKVIPRASTNAVEGWANTEHDTILLKVTAPAEGGKANEAVIKLLADELGIQKSAINIKRGKTSRYKQITLDVVPEVIQTWLEQL